MDLVHRGQGDRQRAPGWLPASAGAVTELVATALESKHRTHAAGIDFVLARTTVVLPSMAGVVILLNFYVRARLDNVEIQLQHHFDVTARQAHPS
jgi:hypothetical protein